LRNPSRRVPFSPLPAPSRNGKCRVFRIALPLFPHRQPPQSLRSNPAPEPPRFSSLLPTASDQN